MGFDPQTVQRMRELFGGRKCCKCGHPAGRLADDVFYCNRHFPGCGKGRPRSSSAPRPAADFAGPPAQSLAG